MKYITQLMTKTMNKAFCRGVIVLLGLLFLTIHLGADTLSGMETQTVDLVEQRKVRIIPFIVLGLIFAFFAAKWVNKKSKKNK